MKNVLVSLAVVFLSHSAVAQQNYKIFINEFLASNVSVDADIVDFDDYSDWIELYNDEDFDADLGGYYLTDNFNNPTRWQIPAGTIIKAKSFLRFWADGHDDEPGHTYRRDYYPYDYFTTKYYHLNFSLNRADEEIALYTPGGILVDSVTYGLQLPDVSVGRKPDGSANWFYFGDPTPVDSNLTEGVLNTSASVDPVITLQSGFYSGPQLVTITAQNPNTVIKYTLDGSRPTSFSETYTAPVSITSTTVLRVRAFEPGILPGKVLTRSYFINENINLPVISIAVPPDVMWNNTYGIYDNNFKERELPVHFEYIEQNGTEGFELDAGLRLTGQASIFYPQKSFTISTDDRFGTDEITYQVFNQRELNIFRSLYLRNAGVPDNRSTFFRDALQHSLLINKIDLDLQAYRPAMTFINGAYWGIYNVRDKIDKDYLSTLHNINPDDVDLLEYNAVPTPEEMEGNADNYSAFYNYINNNNLSLEENYRFIEGWMDIDEYINYQICEIFYDNVFWPDQNIRMWRERKEGAKWRWILHDLDFGFGMANQISIGYRNNTLKHATSSNTGDPFVPPLWSTLIFRKLLANDEFKVKFIQRFSSYLNSVFHPDTVLTIINRLQSNLSPEMSRHISRWRTGDNYYGLPIQNYSEWISNVEVMKDFARNRHIYQRQHIKDYFGLPGTSIVVTNFDEQDMGKILINNAEEVKQNRTGLYFKDIPLELKAVPEVGYRFVRWTGILNEYENPVIENLTEDTLTITAQFEPVSINIIPSFISADITLQTAGSPYYATGTVKVDSGVTLIIEKGVEILMPSEASIFINGKILVNGTAEDPVTIKPNDQSGSWGALCIVNATDSSILKNLKITGATKGVDFTRDRAAISGYNSNISLDGIRVEDVQMPVFIQFGNIEIKNCSLTSNASGDLINIKHANYALVENCILSGNDEYDSDAIDYDNINTGIIRNNRIFNFYGFNSDAIDLGENAQNILVENNIIYNVSDKGVSIGGASTGMVRRNVMANCDMGVGIKDFFSHGYMENNTFYSNRLGVASYEKNTGHGGGSADVVNCIFSNSKSSSLLVDNLSHLSVSYSLSNTDNIQGVNNINGDPRFLNNFLLSFGSPAINSGDPSLPYDPDGTVADIGALPFDQYKQLNLVINEIHYNPAEGPSYQFLELVNAGSFSVNLNNFRLGGDISYQFGDELFAAGEYILVAKDKSLYEGHGYKVFQWLSGDLKSMKADLILYDAAGNILDFVNYDNKYWWPEEPDGKGPSLELQSTYLENMVSHNWRSSFIMGGTPGRANNMSQVGNIFINEILASNNDVNEDEHGDKDDWIELFNMNSSAVNIGGIYITDNFNNPFKYQVPYYDAAKTTIPAGGYLLLWTDDQPEQGILHIPFKLDKEGEEIALVQLLDGDTLFIDSVTFPAQTVNVSYGRNPDGSDNWAFFSPPTPYDSNKITGINDNENIPKVFALLQNYPNPFNPVTIIKYELPVRCKVSLIIYDLLGREISVLVNEEMDPGVYNYQFDASNYASGIYLYRLSTGSYTSVRKMILLK